MTVQLVLDVVSPVWCWVCRRVCQVPPDGCGPHCLNKEDR